MNQYHFTKIAFTIMGISVSCNAFADEITGSYVQGDIGLGYLKADTIQHNSVRDALKSSYRKAKVVPRVSVGYDYGDWRVAGDYTHYGKIHKNKNSVSTQTKAHGAGVTVMYDFNTNLPVPLQPYVGFRASLNKVSQQTHNGNTTYNSSSTKLSTGIVAGASYKISRKLSIDAGYRYNRLDSKVQIHEASVGLRYTF